jgi:hypothetical protein
MSDRTMMRVGFGLSHTEITVVPDLNLMYAVAGAGCKQTEY